MNPLKTKSFWITFFIVFGVIMFFSFTTSVCTASNPPSCTGGLRDLPISLLSGLIAGIIISFIVHFLQKLKITIKK